MATKPGQYSITTIVDWQLGPDPAVQPFVLPERRLTLPLPKRFTKPGTFAGTNPPVAQHLYIVMSQVMRIFIRERSGRFFVKEFSPTTESDSHCTLSPYLVGE